MKEYKCKMIKRKGNVYRYMNMYYIIVDKFRYLELKSDNQNLSLKEIYDKLKESKLKYFSDMNKNNFVVEKFLGIVFNTEDFYKNKIKEYKRVLV